LAPNTKSILLALNLIELLLPIFDELSCDAGVNLVQFSYGLKIKNNLQHLYIQVTNYLKFQVQVIVDNLFFRRSTLGTLKFF